MRSSCLYLENRLPFAVSADVRAKNGTLHITVRRAGVPGPSDIPPGRAASYPLNDVMQSCLDGDMLRYALENRTDQVIMFSPGRERMADGPIFEISDGRN